MSPRLRPAMAALPAYVPGRKAPGAIVLASNESPYGLLPAVAAIAEIVGYGLYLSEQEQIASSMTAIVGEGLAFTIISLAAAVAMYRVTWQIDEQIVDALPPEPRDPAEPEPLDSDSLDAEPPD